MQIKDLIRDGKLKQARQQIVSEVKASPSDLKKRTLFFQVLLFGGELEKAERQLEIIGAQNSSTPDGIKPFKDLISAEKERRKILNLKTPPSFLPEAPSYKQFHLDALKNILDDKTEDARTLYKKIDGPHSTISGTIDDKPFTGIRNTDFVLSFYLEVLAHDHYIWIPFENISELIIDEPKTLFDLMWISACITLWEGLTINCCLPVLYPDTFSHPDDLVRLGRKTDWSVIGNSFEKAYGQQVFSIGDDEIPLLEIRKILFLKHDSENSNE